MTYFEDNIEASGLPATYIKVITKIKLFAQDEHTPTVCISVSDLLHYCCNLVPDSAEIIVSI